MVITQYTDNEFLTRLLAPVPSYAQKRKEKLGYRDYPIDAESAVYNEPLVNIADYGVAGQSYWSRPNSLLGAPLPNVTQAILVRESVAKKLQQANKIIMSQQLAKLFGCEVEIYVDNGIRTPELQVYLYNVAYPKHIAKQNPKWNSERVLRRRDELIAKPPQNTSNPSPHMTGAAVDLTLRLKQSNKGYVENVGIELLRASGATNESCNPDYAEYSPRPAYISEELWHEGTRNRRIMYNVLIHCGMQVNPTEMWHYSWGDQMWAKLQGKPAALYGTAPSI